MSQEPNAVAPFPGMVLAAVPILRDPNFYRSVVLVCDHNPEGTFGLVLNREMELEPGQILDELEGAYGVIRSGGPVQPNTLHYLHELGGRIEDTVSIVDGLWWGGDFESLKAEVAAPTSEGTIQFFLGYSGWGEGQLEQEIQEGSWAVATMRPEWLFGADPEGIWREVMLSLGGDWALMANYPDDPRLN
ncbi:MAG: YqgE/AlgH family protein [Rhodothermales bacterium]|nr:YqgE/AlgH family protein [Rhodothermales bacterium]